MLKWSFLVAICSLFAGLLPGCPPAGQTRYFLVAEMGDELHGDSYILPLSEPADIAHARALIRDPEATGATIAVARIGEGGQEGPYVNRNLAGSGETWSWRVTEFVGFSDFSIEIYDGWPTYVEENLDEWMLNTEGTIGFWGYTVVREVFACELSESCLDGFPEHPPHSPLAH